MLLSSNDVWLIMIVFLSLSQFDVNTFSEAVSSQVVLHSSKSTGVSFTTYFIAERSSLIVALPHENLEKYLETA